MVETESVRWEESVGRRGCIKRFKQSKVVKQRKRKKQLYPNMDV